MPCGAFRLFWAAMMYYLNFYFNYHKGIVHLKCGVTIPEHKPGTLQSCKWFRINSFYKIITVVFLILITKNRHKTLIQRWHIFPLVSAPGWVCGLSHGQGRCSTSHMFKTKVTIHSRLIRQTQSKLKLEKQHHFTLSQRRPQSTLKSLCFTLNRNLRALRGCGFNPWWEQLLSISGAWLFPGGSSQVSINCDLHARRGISHLTQQQLSKRLH